MVEFRHWKMSVLKLSKTPSARAELTKNRVFVLAERGIRKRIIGHLWTLFLLQINVFTVLPICWIRKVLEIWGGISLRMDEACFYLVLTLTRTPSLQYLHLLPSRAPKASSTLVRGRLLESTATSSGVNPSLFKLKHRVMLTSINRTYLEKVLASGSFFDSLVFIKNCIK